MKTSAKKANWTYLKQAVPAASAESSTIRGNAKAADAIVVGREAKVDLTLERVPDIDFEVIIAGNEEATAEGEIHGGDAAHQLLGTVVHKLAGSADVPQTAGGIVGASAESLGVGEELHGVNVGVVATEGLHALALTDVPQLGCGVASTRHEDVRIRVLGNGHAHDIAVVVVEVGDLVSSLNVPQDAGHITGRSDNLAVSEEAAARQVSSVGVKLTAHANLRLPAAQVVDGANVVETTASNEATGRRVGTGHDPG